MSLTALPSLTTAGSFSGTRRSDAHAQAVVIPVGCFQLAWYLLDTWHFHMYFCPSGRTPGLFGRLATVPASDTPRCHHTRWGVIPALRQSQSRLQHITRTDQGPGCCNPATSSSVFSPSSSRGSHLHTQICTWRR